MNGMSWMGLLFIIFSLAYPAIATENLTIHFIDVGQGDCILLQFNDKSILIDGGPREMGARVEEYLRDQEVSRLDLMILTHHHDDHIGGLITILKGIPVGKAIDSGQNDSSLIYGTFRTLIKQKNISYVAARRGQEIDFDPQIRIEVLWPPGNISPGKLNRSLKAISEIPWESFAVRALSGDANQNSLVLRITYDRISLLLMADADTVAESRLLSFGDNLTSQILKVGHHGGTSASSLDFLRRVMPAVSIIPVGEGNYYGYPTKRTLSALPAVGSRIYRTDACGDIIVTTDGLSYSVRTEKIC